MNKLTLFLLYVVIFTIPFENSLRLPVGESVTTMLTLVLAIFAFLTVIIKGN